MIRRRDHCLFLWCTHYCRTVRYFNLSWGCHGQKSVAGVVAKYSGGKRDYNKPPQSFRILHCSTCSSILRRVATLSILRRVGPDRILRRVASHRILRRVASYRILRRGTKAQHPALWCLNTASCVVVLGFSILPSFTSYQV